MKSILDRPPSCLRCISLYDVVGFCSFLYYKEHTLTFSKLQQSASSVTFKRFYLTNVFFFIPEHSADGL